MAKFKVGCETGSVTFNPSASTDQIILNGLVEISAGDIIEITRVIDNQTIYNRNVVGGVVTLTWNSTTQQNNITVTPPTIVSSMSSTDELRVYIDYPDKEIPQRVNNIQTGYWAETQMNPITTATTGYAAGQNIGGINSVSAMCRTAQGTVDLTDVSVWSNDNQVFSGVIDLWAISPTNGTYVDSSQQINAGDQDVWLGCIPFRNTDFVVPGGSDTIVRFTKHIPGALKLQNLSSGQDIYYTIQIVSITGSPLPRWNVTDGMYVKFGWTKA